MWGCSMSFPVGGVEASAAEAWRHMRALRHDPPGLAGDGGPRGRTFNAALEQAEQLFVAAAGVGTAARPILLFYGLSQAGRALAAAWTETEDGRLSGHGIKALYLTSAETAAEVAVQGDRRGSFPTIATLLGTEQFGTEIKLGELCGLLPDLMGFPLSADQSRRPIEFTTWTVNDPPFSDQIQTIGCALLPPELGVDPGVDMATGLQSLVRQKVQNMDDLRRQIEDFASPYPALREWFPRGEGQGVTGQRINDRLSLTYVCPPGWSNTGDSARGVHSYLGVSYAFPESASGAVAPHPLLVWWSVLFALSMLARYEPDRWYKHISVASSPEAVPIENLLNLAMSSVPRTLLQVFTQLRDQLAT